MIRKSTKDSRLEDSVAEVSFGPNRPVVTKVFPGEKVQYPLKNGQVIEIDENRELIIGTGDSSIRVLGYFPDGDIYLATRNYVQGILGREYSHVERIHSRMKDHASLKGHLEDRGILAP